MSHLAELCLSYSPVINRKRGTIATRISASRAGSIDTTKTFTEISSVWTEDFGILMLNIGDCDVDSALLQATPNPQIQLEIPSPITQSAEGQEWIIELSRQGFELVLQGIPASELSPQLIKAFRFATIDVSKDRRIADGYQADPAAMSKRRIETVITGVSTLAQMERCFTSGAGAIVGWPFADALERKAPGKVGSSFTTISRLIALINADASNDEMESVIASDPAMAFRLFRYINSSAFGLTAEIQSFDHAMQILGRNRLKKWLALLLVTASEEQNMKPLMYASVCRGFLLEKILSEDGDQEARDSAFILGVFSMLDKLFCEPFEQLLEQVQVPDTVHEALIHNTGSAIPYLNLARAIEESPEEVHDARDHAFVSGKHCNNSLISALQEAHATRAV